MAKQIIFTISDTDAAALDDLIQLQGLQLTATEYAKLLLLNDIHPEQGTKATIYQVKQEGEK